MRSGGPYADLSGRHRPRSHGAGGVRAGVFQKMNRAERRQIEREHKRLVRRNERRRPMFAGDDTKELEIPHERGNYFTFRNLSGPELDEADVAGTAKAAEQMKVLPDVVVNQAMAKDSGKDQPRDEFRGYDQITLVKYGIQSWRGPKCDATKCDDEGKARLDARTLTWAARTVFEMNVRPEGEGEDSASKSSTAKETSRSS